MKVLRRDSRSRLPARHLKYRWYPWVLLAVSLSLTGYASWLSYQQGLLEASQNFALAAGEIKARIEDRIRAYQQVLRGGLGLFAASDRVTREEWRHYVKQLELERDFAGIQGVGFAVHLPPSELAAHEHRVRSEGFPQYSVWPSGAREEYSSIVFLEPFVGRNLRAFGYDMLSEPIRREAMHRARDSGKIAASGKVVLVQETDRDVQPGFLIYLPLYRSGAATETLQQRRQALAGWVYAPFRMSDLMIGILGSLQNRVHVHLYDGEMADPERLLYDNRSPADDAAFAPLIISRPIDVGSHFWTLELRALPGFRGDSLLQSRVLPVAGGGSLISLLLFAIAQSLVKTNLRARAIAARLTDSLRRNRELHHRIVTLAHDGIFALDTDANMTYANARMAEMLGYRAEELIGRPYLQFVDPGEREAARERLARRRYGVSEAYELELLGRNGERISGLLSAAPLLGDKGVFLGSFAVVSDITARKRAEARILRLSALYHALSRTSEAIMQSRDRQELFRQACEIAIDAAGFKLAWIGLLKPETQEVEPVAYHGDMDYLRGIRVSADPTLPEGQGPFGRAIREMKAQVYNDFQNAPESAPWHEAAKRAGIFSAAVFPLLEWGRCIGGMAFYAGQRFCFDEEQVDLLARVAGNISFALDNFRREAERRRAEIALRESDERYWGIFDFEQDPIFLYESDGGLLIDANPAAVRLYGYSLEELKSLRFAELKAPAGQEDACHAGSPLLEQHRKKGGEVFPVEITNSHFVLENRLVTIAAVRDITERMHAEAALRESEARLRTAIVEAPIPIMLHAEGGEIILLSRTWRELCGYGPAEIPTIAAWLEKACGEAGAEAATLFGSGRANASGEIKVNAKDGRHLIWDFRSSVLGTMQDGRRLVISMAMDVTLRRASEERVSYLAHHDLLTGLPNRVLLQDRIEQAMSLARRGQTRLALIYFDIDHFKEVNDHWGHDFGDSLLIAVAQRLGACVRESDTIGRLGGDEFIALLPEVGGEDQAAVVAEKIRRAMEEPFPLSGREVRVSASLGIAIFPGDGEDFGSLLKSADLAMYEAKAAGRNRCCHAGRKPA